MLAIAGGVRLTDIPADGHDSSHLELEGVMPDKVVRCPIHQFKTLERRT